MGKVITGSQSALARYVPHDYGVLILILARASAKLQCVYTHPMESEFHKKCLAAKYIHGIT